MNAGSPALSLFLQHLAGDCFGLARIAVPKVALGVILALGEEDRPFEVPLSWDELVMEMRLEGPTLPAPSPEAQKGRVLN